ncbi:MAG TPA: hypothetical protein DCL06_06200 [Corynebacterium variabile]|uniref:Uncharacterized protein n=1 Tax=Corynebacterium variabile TaxID=1727 RepID=A0A3B9QU43_9CORY|nr:hypothetical protein [Corynebacterium variabile]
MNRTADTACARPACRRHASAIPGHQGLCHEHAKAAGLFTKSPDTLLDATPLREHINQCLDQGASMMGIAKACGSRQSVVWRISVGETPTVTKTVYRRLIAATPAMTLMRPQVGTVRRLQALRAQGWSGKALCAALHISPQTLWQLTVNIEDGRTVNPELEARVRDFAADHPEVVGPPSSWAKKHNWLTLYAWDNIDDPNECPNRGLPRKPRSIPADHPAWDRILSRTNDQLMAATGMSRDSAMKLRTRAIEGRVSGRRFEDICAALNIDPDADHYDRPDGEQAAA